MSQSTQCLGSVVPLIMFVNYFGIFFVKQYAHFYLVVNLIEKYPSIAVLDCKYNWKEKQDSIIQKG